MLTSLLNILYENTFTKIMLYLFILVCQIVTSLCFSFIKRCPPQNVSAPFISNYPQIQ